MAASVASKKPQKKYQVTSSVKRQSPAAASRLLTVFAQDPRVRDAGRILTASARVPAENVAPGPRGARVHVVDYDATTDTFYENHELFEDREQKGLLRRGNELSDDARFHAQNVYAIVMSTLTRFESALGRRVRWAFDSHQLKVAPHAFAEANAFYSRRNEALLFGYFAGSANRTVYTCLSHDVVAHETTHALLDGLRSRLMEPSSPDQAALHEAFADVIAILSVLSQGPIVDFALRKGGASGDLIASADLDPKRMRKSFLVTLADEMGEELNGPRGGALRQSGSIDPARGLLDEAEFQLPHRRGEVLVAAVLHAYLEIWHSRVRSLGTPRGRVQRVRAVEDGVAAAERMIRTAIRALDYLPPVDVQFSDFLSALLTADLEIEPDDRLGLRAQFRTSFAAYGIEPVPTSQRESGTWDPPPRPVSYDRSRFASMQRDPDEVFRFIWENREALDVERDAYTYVQDVRPSLRVGEDGFTLEETVAEYVQILTLRADELSTVGLRQPDGMRDYHSIRLYGGGTLIFNEYGQLKLHIGSGVRSKRQQKRLDYLWNSGALDRRDDPSVAQFHRERNMNRSLRRKEGW